MSNKPDGKMFGEDLDRLRSGAMTFGGFARRHRSTFVAWARWIVARKRAHRLMSWFDLDDLVQVAMLACWRAVDSFDPAARHRDGTAVVLYQHVAWAIGRKIEHEIERASGWARKGRKRPAMQVVLDTKRPANRSSMTSEKPDTELFDQFLADFGLHAPDASSRLYVAVVARRAGRSIMLDVVEAAVEGMRLSEIAGAIYQDPERRFKYRLDNQVRAEWRVRQAAQGLRKMFG